MGWIGGQVVALRGDDFPAAVLALLSLATAAVVGWAVLVAVLTSTPAMRRCAFAVGVAGALGLPAAQADERGLDGLPFPDRPVVAGEASVHRSTAVVVRRGDTLWAIARSRLGRHAAVAAVARDVSRWHRANRRVIGADPDLIRPGQRLNPPPKERP